MKKFLTFFLTALLTFSVGWAATYSYTFTSKQFTANNQTKSLGDINWTLDGDGGYWGYDGTKGQQFGSNGSPYKYLTLKTSDIPGTITSITVNASTASSSDGKITLAVGRTTYLSGASLTTNAANYTGTGNASGQIIITLYQTTSRALYIKSITVEWETGASTVAAPTITPNGGEFLTSQQVTLSAEDGASIYYTLDGNDPTSSSTPYTAPFTLTATTTVKAIAVKNDETSSVASATFTKTGVPDIAAALNSTGLFTFTGNAVVVYQHGSYLYIKDETGWGLVYGTVNGTYNNGNILNPGWKATKTVYRGLPEFGSPVADTFSSSDSGDEVTPETLTTIDEDTELNMYAFMSNLKVTEVNNGNISLQGVNFQLRNTIGVSDLPAFEVGKTYNVRGFTAVYNGTYQFYPIWAEEVVTGDPTITLDPTSLTIDDSGTNNSFTVTARNLHENDNGNVSVAHNWVFNTNLTSGTNSIANWNGLQGFNRNYRSVDGTVTVNYEGRALTATDTYTVATEGASQTLTVTYVPSLYIVGNFGNAGWNYSADAATPMTNDGNGIYTATLEIPANSYILFSRKSGETYNWDNNRYFIGAVMDNGQDWVYGVNALPGLLDTDPSNPSKYRPIKFPEGGTYTITIDATNYTFNITKKIVGADDFVLVTNTDEVDTAGEYVLVYSSSTADRAMGQTYNSSGNYYSAVTEGFELDNNIVTLENSNDVNILTLEDAGDGLFYIVDQTGKYIYLNSNSNVVHQASSINQSEVGKYKWSININNKGEVEILNTNFTDNRYLQCNYSANPSRYACYKNTMGNAKLYKRGGSASISVPSTLDLAIPAGATSVDGSVTVTEKNVTGTTTISSVDGDASNFNVTLTGTTLSVTYNGTATQDSPEVITINLVNGEATASITVTGYKVPLTVTIRPIDGATFSHDSMDGTITANADDAVIYYKTNEMDDFEVYNGSFTVTNNMTEDPWVQAYAVCGSETSATVTATYHHVSLSETLFTRVTSTDQLVADNKYILVFDRAESPLALSGNGQAAVVAWSDDNINIAGTSATVFTLGETSDGYTLYCNDGYLTHNGRSTTYSETAHSLSIDADGESGYYIMEGSYYLLKNSQASETGDPFRWYTGTSSGYLAYLFVQGVEEQPTIVSLATIESNNNLLNKKVAVSDELIGAWAYGNKLWAKDQGNASIDKRMAATDQMDYLQQEIWHDQDGNVYHLQTGSWDESNWVVLDFNGLRGETTAAACVGKKLTDVKGTYSDSKNFTITLTDPVTATADADAAALYPGYQQSVATHVDPYDLGYNSYIPANFYESNWNGVDAINSNTYVDNQNDDAVISLYFMNPKVQEVARIWGVWNGNGGFAVYNEGFYNRFGIHGAVNVGGWEYNYGGGGVAADLVKDQAYLFHAVVAKPATTGRAAAPAASNDAASSTLVIYPLDLSAQGSMTAVKDIVGDRTVKSVSYYNIMGVESAQPHDGVNIVVTRYTDGSTSTAKVMF